MGIQGIFVAVFVSALCWTLFSLCSFFQGIGIAFLVLVSSGGAVRS